jgi:hypothetical protein
MKVSNMKFHENPSSEDAPINAQRETEGRTQRSEWALFEISTYAPKNQSENK